MIEQADMVAYFFFLLHPLLSGSQKSAALTLGF